MHYRVVPRARRGGVAALCALLACVSLVYPLSTGAQGTATPKLIWVKEGSPANADVWRSLAAFDSKGGVVTVGSGMATPEGEQGDSAMVAAQLSTHYLSYGAVDWTGRYTPLQSVHTWVTVDAVLMDSQDNTYAAGTLYRPNSDGGPDEDFLIQKIDPLGNRIWCDTYDATDLNGGLDVLRGIALDGHGGVTVLGTSHMTTALGVQRVLTIIHYDPQGHRTFLVHYNDPVLDVEAAAIAADKNGDVCVIGTLRDGRASAPIIIRYNSSGHELWEVRPGGQKSLSAWAVGAAIDKLGSLYVCVNALDGPYSFTCQKYARNGQLTWSVEQALVRRRLIASGVRLTKTGNVAIGFTEYNGGSAYGAALMAPDGTQLWTAYQDAKAGEQLVGSDFLSDGAGNVYVTGLGYTPDGVPRTQVTVKFSATGAVIWRFDYGGARKTMADLPTLAIGAGQTIAVSGITSRWTDTATGPTYTNQPATYLLR